MGEVYEATHARLSGRYAIKLLLRELALRPDAFARFRREAEITSALRHPNIVQVIDFNLMDDESPYLVMEYLDRVDLATRLEQGPLSLSAALPLVKQLASALAAAHGRGIVHRDLKPQNIFLVRVEGEDQEEIPKILDFGISKMKSASKSVTIDAVVLGTPQYMSPEQALGRTEEIDHTTDQFALGAITYEMLTGRQAFVGDDPLAVMYQVVNGAPVPLVAKGGRTAAALEAVLFKAMAKNKADRYATIHEFARALTAVASDAGEIVTGQYDRSLTPAPTMAFGHWTAATSEVSSPAVESSASPPEATAPAQAAPRTPTTFRTAVGEMSPRPRRSSKILVVAGAVVAAATLIGLLAISGRPVPVKASLPSASSRAAALPRPAPATEEAIAPLPAVELVTPVETPAEPTVTPEEPARPTPRRRPAGPSSGQRRAAVATTAPVAPAPVAPAAQVPAPTPPAPPPPKPASDLVKGDDL
jgi:serine/threonine-protein kinase